MPVTAVSPLQPRKTPVQLRSAATVTAILDATLQVLLAVGKERLTTTRVAHRAGVSVGTLYQYFPNKTALLQAALERHLDGLAVAVGDVCRALHHRPVSAMIEGLIHGYFTIKLRNPRASVALYAVSADLDYAKLTQRKSAPIRAAMTAMLRTATPALAGDPDLLALVLQGAMTGVSRSLLEGRTPEKQAGSLQQELVRFASAYLTSLESVTP